MDALQEVFEDVKNGIHEILVSIERQIDSKITVENKKIIAHCVGDVSAFLAMLPELCPIPTSAIMDDTGGKILLCWESRAILTFIGTGFYNCEFCIGNGFWVVEENLSVFETIPESFRSILYDNSTNTGETEYFD